MIVVLIGVGWRGWGCGWVWEGDDGFDGGVVDTERIKGDKMSIVQ